mgnify:CR=1 FL=1
MTDLLPSGNATYSFGLKASVTVLDGTSLTIPISMTISKNFSCYDHPVKVIQKGYYSEDMTFILDSGKAEPIKQSIFEKLFKTSSKACEVDEYEIVDADESQYELAGIAVYMKGDDIEIDTN